MDVTYRIGLDNRVYAVFEDNIACEDHEDLFPGHHGIACFGAFENALCVQDIWGQ